MLTGNKYSVQSPPKTGDRGETGVYNRDPICRGRGAWWVQIGLWRGRRDPNRPGGREGGVQIGLWRGRRDPNRPGSG